MRKTMSPLAPAVCPQCKQKPLTTGQGCVLCGYGVPPRLWAAFGIAALFGSPTESRVLMSGDRPFSRN